MNIITVMKNIKTDNSRPNKKLWYDMTIYISNNKQMILLPNSILVGDIDGLSIDIEVEDDSYRVTTFYNINGNYRNMKTCIKYIDFDNTDMIVDTFKKFLKYREEI